MLARTCWRGSQATIPPAPAADEARARRQVVDAYHLGACIRRPSEQRKAAGERGYHKGWELRFYADTEHDAHLIARLLAGAGLKAGRPYLKRQDAWIVPLYGHRAVDQVLAWVDDAARTG